ncbi:MAG: porin family protein [Holosporaceae bacterium]|jgi:opacity protein-like surface antigen|nr:porin family protein [Holosporaceae bacterium]
MKKYALLTVSGVLFFAAANADQSVLAVHEEPVVVAAEPEPQPTVLEQEEEYNSPFSGVYVTLGIGGNFLSSKIDGNLDPFSLKSDNARVNRVAGIVGLGGGKVLNNTFYIGGEVLCDFSGSKEKNLENIHLNGNAVNNVDAKVKISAVIPSVALRLGYFNKNVDMLFFAKIAASYASVKVTAPTLNNGVTIKGDVSTFSPAIGLGIEKAFGKKFSGRLEGEYRFSSSKDLLKAASGLNVRALVAYHINGI